jgi:hypothetical protein
VKGTLITVPQDLPTIRKMVPCLLEDVAKELRIVWLGTQRPSHDVLKKSYGVRKDRVIAALDWLCEHHPKYREEFNSPDHAVHFQHGKPFTLDLPTDGSVPQEILDSISFQESEVVDENTASYVPNVASASDDSDSDSCADDQFAGDFRVGAVDGDLSKVQQDMVNQCARSNWESDLRRLQDNLERKPRLFVTMCLSCSVRFNSTCPIVSLALSVLSLFSADHRLLPPAEVRLANLLSDSDRDSDTDGSDSTARDGSESDSQERSDSDNLSGTGPHPQGGETVKGLAVPTLDGPLDWWFAPDSWAVSYPRLFPYGVGMPESDRPRYLSLNRWVKHVMRADDSRFRHDWSVLFTAYNVLRVRRYTWSARLKSDSSSATALATKLNAIDLENLRQLVADTEAAVAAKRQPPKLPPDVASLLRAAQGVAGKLDDSDFSNMTRRLELRSLMVSDGPPTIFLTINPNDLNHPLALHFCGIQLDLSSGEGIPKLVERARLLSSDPVASADFFETMIQAVIKGLLRYEKHETQYISKHMGLFGRTKNYYGQIECTSRGCLHWHCLVWIWGAQQLARRMRHSPDLKANIEKYTDLIICQSLDEEAPFVHLPRGYRREQSEFLDYCPECYPAQAKSIRRKLKTARKKSSKQSAVPVAEPRKRTRRHSTKARTLDPRTCCSNPPEPWATTPLLSNRPAWRRDQARLATKCQMHTHTSCCFKYTKAGLIKVCRFNFNGTVGKQLHRRTHWMDGALHGARPDDTGAGEPDKNRWLNSYNQFILGACRCNHDVKFIPTLSDSLALMYYITVPDSPVYRLPACAHVWRVGVLSVYVIGGLCTASIAAGLLANCGSITVRLMLDCCLMDVPLWLDYQYIAVYDSFPQAYITKGELKNSTALPLLASALYSLEAAHPVTTVNDRDASVERLRLMLVKCVNKLEHFSERSGPWCVRFLQGKRNHHTNRLFKALCWGNALRAVRKHVDDSILQSAKVDGGSDTDGDEQCPPVVDGSRVVVMGPDGDLALVSDYLDYARRPTHSDIDSLSLYLFASSWAKTAISLKSRHRIRVSPGYSGPDVAGQEDEDPPGTVCAPHPQANTHGWCHRPGTVPALYGPKVPLRPGLDASADDKETYAAMILVLFKPWRAPSDLRGENDSWWHAFTAWESEIWQLASQDGDGEDVLRARRTVQVVGNLQALAQAQVDAAAITKKRRADILQAASLNPQWKLPKTYHPVNPDDDTPLSADDYVQLMRMFKRENQLPPDLHQAVRRVAKMNMMQTPATAGAQRVARVASPAESERLCDKLQRLELENQRTERLSEEKECSDDPGARASPSVAHVPATFDVNELGPKPYTLDGISRLLNLHWRQRLAVDIVAAQLFKEMCKDGVEAVAEIHGTDRTLLFAETPKQLLLHVAGCAGTGKSRVLDAVRLLFQGYDRSDWLEVGAFTGTAAANVDGRTLHALTGLNLGEDGQRRHGQKLWRHVRFLAIDEISMLGCKLLGNVSSAVSKAKGTSEHVLGGVHTIFIGDQAQLPPVKDPALYRRRSKKYTTYQKLGRSIWRQLNRCVVLTFIWRTKARSFTAVLDRLRWGECTGEDFIMLSGLVVEDAVDWSPAVQGEEYVYHPCIVPGNKLREALNRIAVMKHAKKSNTRVLSVAAVDKRRGIPVPEPDRSKLLARPEHLCGFRPGYLHLVKGAMYILKRNKAPELGLYNSSPMTLEQILFNPGHEFQSLPMSPGEAVTLSSCPAALLMNVTNARHDNFECFGDGILPLLPSDKHWQLPLARRGVPKDKWPMKSYTRTQFELVLAYALTAHAAQGLTLTRMDADLASCKFYGSAYTILTRCETAEDIHLIRAFDRRVLQKQPPTDLVLDWKRLATLETATLARFRPFLRVPNGETMDKSYLGTPPSRREIDKPGLRPRGLSTVGEQLMELDMAALDETWIRDDQCVLDCLAYHLNRPNSQSAWNSKRGVWTGKIRNKLGLNNPPLFGDQLAMLRSAASALRVAIHVLRTGEKPVVLYPSLARPPKSHLYLVASDSSITTCAVRHRKRPVPLVRPAGSRDSESESGDTDSSHRSSGSSEQSASDQSSGSSEDELTCTVPMQKGKRKGQACGRPNDPCVMHAVRQAGKGGLPKKPIGRGDRCAVLLTRGENKNKACGLANNPCARHAVLQAGKNNKQAKSGSRNRRRSRGDQRPERSRKRQKDRLAHGLQERTNTPLALVASLALSLSTGVPLADAVAAWLQKPDLRLDGFFQHEHIALDSLLMAHGAKSDMSEVVEHQRHLGLLAQRVQSRNWVLPTDSVHDLIRTQGDCFPDSIAYLLWCSQPDVARVPERQWYLQRFERSARVRTRLVHWLRQNEHTPVPQSDPPYAFGLLQRDGNESWRCFCDRMERLRGANGSRYAEAAMVAAAACVYKVKVTIASSSFLDGATFYPVVYNDSCSIFRLAHSAYSQGHFVPAVAADQVQSQSPVHTHRWSISCNASCWPTFELVYTSGGDSG